MGKRIDITGQQFNRWTVLEFGPTETAKHPKKSYWKCECSCGAVKSVRGDRLRNGESRSCGCLKIEEFVDRTKKDLTNQKFGKLTALYPTEKRRGNHIVWVCKCDCGNTCEVSGAMLTIGHTNSCGCLNSVGESAIQTVLEMNHISFIKEKTFPDFIYKETGGSPRYDFYLPEYNRLIEFDGSQHYQNNVDFFKTKVENQKERDKLKNEYALSHNIELIRIPYWQQNNITLEMLLGDKYLVKE